MVAVRFAFTGIVVLTGCHEVFGTENVVPPDAPTTYVTTVLADEPTAYYRLGEVEGVTAHDLRGGPSGQYVSTFRLGEPGAIADDVDTGVFLGPEDASVMFGDIHDFSGLTPFTIEAWVKPEREGSFQVIASRYSDPPVATGYLLYTIDDTLAFARGITQMNQTLVEADVLAAGAYTHAVATFDGQMMRLYANGVQIGAKASAIALPPPTVDFTIGSGNGTARSGPFYGALDEVAIYGRALDPEEVFEHHAVGAAQAQRAR